MLYFISFSAGNLGTVKTSTASTGTGSNGTGTGTGTTSVGQGSPTSKTDDGSKNENKMEGVEITPENDITPVGVEYIEEITNDEGTIIIWSCIFFKILQKCNNSASYLYH